MVMVAESTHFDGLTNHVRYRREPLTFVRSGNTVVLQLYMLIYIVAWAREVIVYSCARSRLLMARYELITLQSCSVSP